VHAFTQSVVAILDWKFEAAADILMDLICDRLAMLESKTQPGFHVTMDALKCVVELLDSSGRYERVILNIYYLMLFKLASGDHNGPHDIHKLGDCLFDDDPDYATVVEIISKFSSKDAAYGMVFNIVLLNDGHHGLVSMCSEEFFQGLFRSALSNMYGVPTEMIEKVLAAVGSCVQAETTTLSSIMDLITEEFPHLKAQEAWEILSEASFSSPSTTRESILDFVDVQSTSWQHLVSSLIGLSSGRLVPAVHALRKLILHCEKRNVDKQGRLRSSGERDLRHDALEESTGKVVFHVALF
jgi:hypothetical protein